MKPLSIAATKSTPSVQYEEDEHTLRLEGESYPEDAARFYQPLFQWLRGCLAPADARLSVDLRVSYLNTSSSKCMLTILDILEEAYQAGRQVSVRWRYSRENEMALECGTELSDGLRLPFCIVEEP
jgi:hypothetical protein